MRRIIPIILLLVVFGSAACVPAGGGTNPTGQTTPADTTEEAREPLTYKEVFDPETDFDNRFGRGIESVVSIDEVYYFTAPGGRYLYYSVKESDERGVLCGKPECLHDAESTNKECNGSVNIIGTLGLWDDRLHFLTITPGDKENYAILSMDLDGSDRRVDTYTSLKIGDIFYTPQRLDYHRGMLYCWCKIEVVNDGVPSYENCIFTMDPQSGMLNKLYSVEADFIYDKPSLFYFGKYVYFYFGYRDLTENDDLINHLELRRYDTETKKVEDVFVSSVAGDFGARLNIWVESEELIYLIPYVMPEGVKNKLYKIENGQLGVAADFDTEGIGGILDGAAFVGNSLSRKMEVRSFSGDIIWAGDWELDLLSDFIPGEDLEYYIGDAFGDESELIVGIWLVRTSGIGNDSMCLIGYDLTEENPQAKVIAYDPWA